MYHSLALYLHGSNYFPPRNFMLIVLLVSLLSLHVFLNKFALILPFTICHFIIYHNCLYFSQLLCVIIHVFIFIFYFAVMHWYHHYGIMLQFICESLLFVFSIKEIKLVWKLKVNWQAFYTIFFNTTGKI